MDPWGERPRFVSRDRRTRRSREGSYYDYNHRYSYDNDPSMQYYEQGGDYYHEENGVYETVDYVEEEISDYHSGYSFHNRGRKVGKMEVVH